MAVVVLVLFRRHKILHVLLLAREIQAQALAMIELKRKLRLQTSVFAVEAISNFDPRALIQALQLYHSNSTTVCLPEHPLFVHLPSPPFLNSLTVLLQPFRRFILAKVDFKLDLLQADLLQVDLLQVVAPSQPCLLDDSEEAIAAALGHGHVVRFQRKSVSAEAGLVQPEQNGFQLSKLRMRIYPESRGSPTPCRTYPSVGLRFPQICAKQ